MNPFMTLKNVKLSLRKISKSLASAQTSREFLIKNTREVIILCSQSIIAVHNKDLKTAKIKVQRANLLLSKYRKGVNGELQKYLIVPEQELVEALALLAIVQKKEIPSKKSMGVSDSSYILGLLDCIGELKRLVFDKIRLGHASEASKFFEIMENLYLYLYPFSIYDKIVKEARRKLDVNRILLEETRSALTEEIRRLDLIEALNKIK
jgi:translin